MVGAEGMQTALGPGSAFPGKFATPASPAGCRQLSAASLCGSAVQAACDSVSPPPSVCSFCHVLFGSVRGEVQTCRRTWRPYS